VTDQQFIGKVRKRFKVILVREAEYDDEHDPKRRGFYVLQPKGGDGRCPLALLDHKHHDLEEVMKDFEIALQRLYSHWYSPGK
jgi:hypothetical protein